MAEKTLSVRGVGRALRSARTRAVLTIGCVLGLGAVGTLAYWTDSVAITGGTFSAGHLDLQVNNSDAPPPVTSLAMSNMAPGESVAATFTVQNKGTVDFTYTLGATASGALAPYLRFSTYTGGSASNGTSGGLRTGSCSGAAQTTTQTLSASSTAVIPSAQTLVNTSGSQVVCVVATLDSATPNSVGGNTATATFTAGAKQLGAP